MAWKLISKLAKNRMIHREHLVAYWPQAVQQLSSLFGMTSSERLPTIVSFLSTMTSLKPEDLPLADKIAIVELVLSKVEEQMNSQQNVEDLVDQLEAAYKAICTFFHNVTQYFTNIMTASGRNNSRAFGMNHQRLELNYDFEDDDDEDFGGGGSSGLANQLLTADQ